MLSIRSGCVLLLMLVYSLTTICHAAESDVVRKYLGALQEDNSDALTALIKEHREEIPVDIGKLLDEALLPETTGEEREGLFHFAERMARSYMDVTGDVEVLKGVKQRIFESKISPPVHTMRGKEAHVVQATSRADEKYLFMPDNIVIKKGETVRWVNSDTVEHLVGSVPFIGRGGIMTPRMKPGEKREYSFKEAGEYYYICFIHKVMYGKVTVEE